MLNPTKKCTACGEEKAREDFYAHGKYVQPRCKRCTNKGRRAYITAWQKEKRTDPEYRLKRNFQKMENQKKKYAANPAYRAMVLAKNKQREQGIKDRVFMAYGGYRCACCGVTGRSFLSIDHMGNDGANHRRTVGLGGAPTYRWLAKNNFPQGFQVLCYNCNWSKHINHGTCEHKIIFLEGSSTIPQGSTVEAIATGSASGLPKADHDIVSSAQKCVAAGTRGSASE